MIERSLADLEEASAPSQGPRRDDPAPRMAARVSLAKCGARASLLAAAAAAALMAGWPGAVAQAQTSAQGAAEIADEPAGGVTSPAAEAAPVDPASIPHDIRPPTPAEQAEMEALDARTRAALAAGDGAAAETAARALLAIEEITWGPDHPWTGGTHELIAEALEAQGDLAGAARETRRALEISAARLGPAHRRTYNHADWVIWKMESLRQAGESEAALILAEAITATPMFAAAQDKMQEVQFRSMHIRALEVVAEAARDQGDLLRSFDTMQAMYEHFVAMGGSDSSIAKELRGMIEIARTNIPNLLLSAANSAVAANGSVLAERYVRDSVEFSERVNGVEHPTTLNSLSVLGGLLSQLGRASEAEPIERRALETSERVYGPEHAETLARLSNLVVTLNHLGRAAEAETLARRKLEASERLFGPDDPQTINALNNLAGTLKALGRVTEAEPLERRALELSERVFGEEHPDIISHLNQMALVLRALGRAAEAEPLLRRALDLSERRLGPENISTLKLLHNLATTVGDLGRLTDAEQLLGQALEASARVLGDEHPVTLTQLTSIAVMLSALGRAAEAEPLERRALEVSARVLGEEHPDTLIRLDNLTWTLLSLSRPSEALPFARRALEARLSRSSAASGSSEATRTALGGEAASAGRLVALSTWRAAVSEPGSEVASLRGEAFSAIQAAGRGSAAEALARAAARAAAGVAGLEAVVRDWERGLAERDALDGEATEVAAAAAGGGVEGGAAPDAATLAARRAALAERRAEVERRIASAETRLGAEFPRFFELANPAPVGVGELQAGLEGGRPLLGAEEALVLLSPPEGDFPGLVFAVSREGLAWAEIPLDAAVLAAKTTRLHAMLDGGGGARAPQVGGGGAPLPAGMRGFDRALAFELHEALFGAPEIRAVLAGKPDWILAPQGVFLALPFAALATAAPEGADDDPAALRATPWLGLERALSVTPSVSSLRFSRGLEKARRAGPAAAFFGLGDPEFAGAGADGAGAAQDGAATAGSGSRGAGAADGAVRTASLGDARSYFRDATADASSLGSLPRLPGTRVEAEAMAAAFGAGPESLLLGADATETRLAAADGAGPLGRARVVLLATHGLLAGSFAGLEEPALALTPPAGGPRPIDPAEAGAAPGEASGAASGRGARLDDGLLTASEAARLDLDADWVILSACDTAAGADGAPGAEGLSGLARGFLYAGARSLLVSHWKVRDDVAARLTTDAVRRAAETPGLSRARALRDAMRAILEDRSYDADDRAFAHPSAWAPFHLVGAGAPAGGADGAGADTR